MARPTRSRGSDGPPPDYTPRIRTASDLEEVLDRLPDEPGVYVMRDRKGNVVYVGKAKRLRVRVRQYFSGHDTRFFVPLLGKLLGDIETIVTNNDKEALLLENNLIKEHRPRFNVKLRDDKNYLVLRLDPRGRWPRLQLVRNIKQDGAHYFGPYHSAVSARSTLRVVNRHFQLRTCTDYTLDHRSRPCLQFQIGRCPAPCVHDVDPAAYDQQVKDVALFLTGRYDELIGGLRRRMESAATDLEFEVAARLRDQVGSIETTLQSQRIVSAGDDDQDVVGLYREGGQVEFVVLQVRGGKLLGTQSFSEKGMELPDAEVLSSFLSAYYQGSPALPDEVLLPLSLAVDDSAPLEAWLRERKERKVAVKVPARGARKRLVDLACRNAASNFATRRNQREDSEQALARLRSRLGLSRTPHRIECFDISHIQGTDVVASMVVFMDGVADKKLYRSFKIRGIRTDGDEATRSQGAFQNDDFASMYEVLARRFRRAVDGEDEAWAAPDLVVIDGGKGQLARASAALSDLGVVVGAEGVDIVALAKERRNAPSMGKAGLERLRARGQGDGGRPGGAYEDWAISDESGELEIRPERVFVPGIKDPVVLKPGSSERYLMERVRDEAHRFAITHHRKRRGKRSLRSVLDDIEGVGPALKKALVEHFGSVAAIRAADEDALRAVRGVGPALAARIRASVGRSSGAADDADLPGPG